MRNSTAVIIIVVILIVIGILVYSRSNDQGGTNVPVATSTQNTTVLPGQNVE